MNTPRLLIKYRKEVVPAIMAKFGYKTVMAAPRIKKVIVSVGTGRVVKEPKLLERIEKDLAKITGQKAASRGAKKAIASFKTRVGDHIGYQITLRGKRSQDFLNRLVHVALPRTKDFKGISSAAVIGKIIKGNSRIRVK